MKILLVSQMYPGPDAPDLGTFVAELETALGERGHELDRAVVCRRGGRTRHLALARDVVAAARRFRPDVVYAHFLVPAGFLAAVAGNAPCVVTAHGQDVENARSSWWIRRLTQTTVGRASAVIAVSDWLGRRLVEVAPEATAKLSVIDCGVDLDRFEPTDRDAARQRLGWHPAGTGYVCVGALSERKNVLGLARAVERLDDAELALIGDGPLRLALTGRARIRLEGPVAHGVVPEWLAAADVVCQPSLAEPFGIAALEAMASARSVVATSVGGPPEFVTPDAGVLVEPGDDDALVAALAEAAALPRPNDAARRAAEQHDVRRQAARVEEVLLRVARDRPA